jgi:hypothetical protein
MRATAKKSAAVSAGSAARKAWETRRANGTAPSKSPRPPIKLTPLAPINLPKNVKAIPVEQMLSKTVVLVLTISGIGNRRKVDPKMITVDADKAWLGVTKKLYESEELDEINSIGNETRMWVESRALPSNIKRGVHLLPVEFIEEVDAKMKDGNARRVPLVEKMIRRVKEYQANAKARLNKLYDESQYLTPAQLRAAFDIRWRYVWVDSAKQLESVSPELYAEECKKAQAAGVELRESIQQLMRAEFMEKLNHFIDRLSPNEHGEKKSFREGSIDKFREFCKIYNPRDITNDVQVRTLVEHAESLMGDVDVDSLRNNDDLRKHIRTGFENIKNALDPLVVDKPHRRIIIEE